MIFPRRARRLARRFGWARALCVALMFGLALLRIADPPLIEEIRVRTFDTYQVIQPRIKAVRPVVIIDIDEKSLSKYGQWPWPRTRLAELLDRLKASGAGVIAFDIAFPERDRMSPPLAADGIAGLDDDTRNKLRALPDSDEVFADAIRRSRVVLGEGGRPVADAQLDSTLPLTGLATLGGDPRPFMVDFPGLVRNLPTLEKAAAGRGLFTIRVERDGIVRRVPVMMLAQGEAMPSLSFEMLRVATGTDTIFIKTDRAGIRSIAVKGLEIPTDRNGQVWVHFARHDPEIYISAADILDGAVAPERLARRLVLIGTSSVGLLDVKTTPVDPVMPGVELHAQVIESVLTQQVLAQPNYGIGAELCIAFILGIAVIWLAPLFGPITLVALGAFFAALLVGTSWLFYTQYRLLIDFTYPLLSTTLIYLVLIFANFVREQAQRRRIRSAFSRYLSPSLVEELAQSPEKLVLGGEERVMTIMFSDIRGFTTIAETYKNNPKGLTVLMNRFLTPLTNAILNKKGTIDKYMGDAIMAFWNAPLDDAAHQINACSAALDMIDCLDALNAEREAEAASGGHVYIPLRVGIGLNTGACVVGNIGSDLRFDYSVLGDGVNVASRLEGLSKQYGFPIIAGASTAEAVRGVFAMLELDFVMVKGKTEPEVIYAIAGHAETSQSPRFQQLRDLTVEMLACYRKQDWDGALAAIDRGRQAGAKQLEQLFELYTARIAAFKTTAPPDGWTGAYALLSK